MCLTTYHFVKLMCFFVKICKISEFRIPCWLRTLRSTSPSKTTTGNTFLGFRKLVTNFLSAFPEDSLLVWRLKSTRSPSGRQSQMHGREWVVARTAGGFSVPNPKLRQVVCCFLPSSTFLVVALLCTSVAGVFQTPSGQDSLTLQIFTKWDINLPKLVRC